MIKYGLLLFISVSCYPLLRFLYKRTFIPLCFASIGAFLGTFTSIPIIIGLVAGVLFGTTITYLSLRLDAKYFSCGAMSYNKDLSMEENYVRCSSSRF